MVGSAFMSDAPLAVSAHSPSSMVGSAPMADASRAVLCHRLSSRVGSSSLADKPRVSAHSCRPQKGELGIVVLSASERRVRNRPSSMVGSAPMSDELHTVSVHSPAGMVGSSSLADESRSVSARGHSSIVGSASMSDAPLAELYDIGSETDSECGEQDFCPDGVALVTLVSQVRAFQKRSFLRC